MKKHSNANRDTGERLSDRIRSARRRAAMSQTDLSLAVGVSASAIAQWEHPDRTQPSLENLIKAASATGVSFEWLAIGCAERKGAGRAQMANVPAVTLDVYARNPEEEMLLERFRDIPASRRSLLIAIAEEFAAVKRTPLPKRR